MSRLFDELEDETPESLGKEVGAALSQALIELSAQQDKTALLVTKAIKDAINAVDQRNIVVKPEAQQPIIKWVFSIKRDRDGLMTTISATAE